MAKSYKTGGGLIRHRTGGGRFRRTTLKDIGINDGNTECQVYICNVCEKEFIPLVHSGKCCGVDNKRKKEVIYTEEQQKIINQINDLRKKPFINRQILEQIQQLERQLTALK